MRFSDKPVWDKPGVTVRTYVQLYNICMYVHMYSCIICMYVHTYVQLYYICMYSCILYACVEVHTCEHSPAYTVM